MPRNGVAPTAAHIDNAFLPGTGRFKADMAVGDLDYNATQKDTVALKYFYQHDPAIAPYSYSSVPGFSEHLDSGAQVFAITNTLNLKTNLSTTQTLGFIREKIWGDNEQAFGPDFHSRRIARQRHPSTTFGSKYFPGVSVYNVLGGYQPLGTSTAILNIGPNAEGQAANTGVFQNRLSPSGNAIWILGKHTVSFGASYSYTQLNTIDKRTGTGTVATDDFSQFVQGFVTPGSSATGFYVSSFLQGNASRYYRSNQLGTYFQDKWQLTPTLSLTAGLRYDWDGGLTEKYGRIFNFDSQRLTSTKSASDTIENTGLIIAGNNTNGTRGVSPTTLTGRQWGIAPRLGCGMAAGILPQQGGGPRRRRLVLRPRRTVQLLLAGIRHRHGYRRSVRREPAASVRERVELPGCQRTYLYYYIPTCGGSVDPDTGLRSARHPTRRATWRIPMALRCSRRPITPRRPT